MYFESKIKMKTRCGNLDFNKLNVFKLKSYSMFIELMK